MLGKRLVIGIGAKSSIKAEDIRDAFGVWFLPQEFEVLSMDAEDEPRIMCHTLASRHPIMTCIALQGGKVAMVENGAQVAKDGEWAYFSSPDYGEYVQVIMPDPLYVQQQHMKHAHGIEVEGELAQQRAPAQVLLHIILDEMGALPQNLRAA